jgi:glucose-1-phosphate cytidylyltransferase
MKVVILAGGFGSRLAEETDVRPKPMIEVGGMPVIWHIMKMFDHYGLRDFIIALGYRGDMIKSYFKNFAKNHSHVRVDLSTGDVSYTDYHALNWRIDLVDTGQATLTGGRLKRLEPFIGNEPFVVAYGDGVSDLDIGGLVDFHKAHGKIATLTAVRPTARFGHVEFEGDRVREFSEKPQTAEGWINGGFFVFNSTIFDYIEGDYVDLSREPLERLTREQELMAFKHYNFWQCMDTLREKFILESLWESRNPPWKTWKD